MDNSFYIYALKDPRGSIARPFYIGKGTGTRAYDHLASVDQTAKGIRIGEIQASGSTPVVTILADQLSELQALKLEAELIASFGTEENGGTLTNSVVPRGLQVSRSQQITVPLGAREKAQMGLALLKDAVLELAKVNSGGIRNADASRALGLQSDYGGGSKDYLAFSIIGILMREGRLKRDETRGRGRHVAQVQ